MIRKQKHSQCKVCDQLAREAEDTITVCNVRWHVATSDKGPDGHWAKCETEGMPEWFSAAGVFGPKVEKRNN